MLVSSEEAVRAVLEPGLSWPGPPPPGRGPDPGCVVAWPGGGSDRGVALPRGGDEGPGGVGGVDRLLGGPPALPAGLCGPATGGLVDRESSGGEVQRLECVGAV